jgi:uncharacterized secreted protein with C-terminal beta-propeller domain
MKKRILTMILAVSMLLALAACAGTEGGDFDVNRRERAGNNVGGELIPTADSGEVTTLASSYDEIYDMIMELNARNNEQLRSYARDDFSVDAEEESSWSNDAAPASEPMAVTAAESDGGSYSMDIGGDAMGGGRGEAPNYSDTNNQVDGVQESDIVKTDGRNIYIASHVDSSINVIAVNNGNMEAIAKIKQSNENTSISEMLLYDGKLITIWSGWEQIELNMPQQQGRYIVSDWYWGNWHWEYETIVEVYDTSGDFSSPVSSYSQKGWYNSSRMIGNNIYIISSFYPPVHAEFARTDLQYYIPSYTVNGVTSFVPAPAIALPEMLERVEYTVIGGLDVNQTDMLVSASANLGGTHLIYASLNNIYLTRTDYESGDDWSWWQNYTVINKFSMNAGNVSFRASGRVTGYVGNQFYMDEHRGILRIVTEVWGEMEASEDEWWRNWGPHGASLYTMDENLNILDEKHGIGFGENVQSVRFEGDLGYIVTFFMVDPLFSFDLSNPHNIVQLDELKIPGFSRYLHRWADGLLLGIGVEADEEDGIRTGLKVSMFDTSDNENLFERHVYIITRESFLNNNNNQDWWSDNWSWSWMSSPAEWEHKSILICTERNIIGFPYNYQRSTSHDWHNENLYVIFSYDAQTGFTLVGEIEYSTDGSDNWWWGGGFLRGLYIGDYLYITAEDRVVSVRLDDFSVTRELRFFDYAAWYAELQAQWELEWAQWEEEKWEEEIWDDGDWDDGWDGDYIEIMPLPEVIQPRG